MAALAAVAAVAAAVALPVAIVLGRYWQDRIRELMGVPLERPRPLGRPGAVSGCELQ